MTLSNRFETKVVTAFGTAMVVVAVLAASTWKVADDATVAARLVTHTHEIINDLTNIRAFTLQAELTTQSFRLTGDPQSLVERDEASAARERALERVRQSIGDNAQLLQHWTELRRLLDQRLAFSKRIEELRKTQGQAAASAYVATAPLRATRARTYELLKEMDAEERARLAERIAAHDHARQTQVRAGALVAVALAALLLATYLLIRRQLHETEASQRALADSEDNLSTTLQSIGDGVMTTDVRGNITRMNPVAEQLTGWSMELAMGRPVEQVFHIIHEGTRAPAEVPIAKVLTTGEPQLLANHTALIARDGSEHPIADSAAPIKGTDGAIRGVVLIFRDVTAEHMAEKIIRDQNALLASHVRDRTARLHESETHLRSIMRAVPVLIAYVNTERRYVYVNNQYREHFAPERDDLSGCTVREILGEARYAVAGPLVDKVLEGQPQSYDWQPTTNSWQTIRYIPRQDDNGEVTGYYVLGTDVTERKLFENRIQSLNGELAQRVRDLEHVSRALRTLSSGNRTMLRAYNEEDLLQNMCRAVVTSGGYGMAVVWFKGSDPQAALRPIAECGYPGGMEMLQTFGLSPHSSTLGNSVTSAAIREGVVKKVRNMQSDLNHAPWATRLEGLKSGLSCPLRVDGDVIGALTIYDPEPDTFDDDEITLLTELADDLAFGIATLRARDGQARVQAAMHHMLRHDTLTGLPNAIEFTEAVETAVGRVASAKEPVAILQFNIERLGEINEVLGFNHGDQVLRDFGRRLRDSVPETAIVARLRGDEFAVLTAACDAAAALALAETLEASLSTPFAIADIELDVTAKAGIALYPDHGSTAQDLMRGMGKALFQARSRGVSRCVFDPGQQQDQIERLSMAGELRRAIESGQMRLYLQPKVEFSSGKVCGAEALVRWQHPRLGLVAPGVFIGLAEKTGLIKPLTEWLVITTLDLLQAWQTQDCALPIAVNLSARNFRDEQLFDKFRLWQSERGVARGLLEAEITESTVMDDAEYALRVLHALRDEGVPLYVDDFGTGYSSLSYLQKLPVDYIKIDQSFVAAMRNNRDSAMIVRSTIDLVHDLGHRTVAEGVETQEHWNMLSALGCDIAQGYFIARPMPSETFQAWLASYRAPENIGA
ncbi:EAL domain-containing protein [Rhodoferax sp. GW822-FHT02A01]|uniref:EAL domain-containing protein n=1 Tax=Rhodoferax sp. GW822-FHT02A01 TaxID=3141537 RepID=UPI00315DC292